MKKNSAHHQTQKVTTDLPPEILENVFHFLSQRTFLKARTVSTEWLEASNFFWENMYLDRWTVIHHIPLMIDEKINWKKLFMERSKTMNFVSVNTRRNTLFSSNSDTKLNKGFAMLYRNDHEKAIEYFAESAKLKPTARAYEGLTRIHYHQKNYNNVIIFAEACLNYSPINLGEIYYLRARALYALNRLEEALKDFNSSLQYISISPIKYHLDLKNSEVYFDRMVTNIELADYDAAFEDCKKISTTFREGDCFMKCAKILFDKKLFFQAERFLLNSSEKSKEYYLLGMRVECCTGKYEEALEFYRKYQAKMKNEPMDQFDKKPNQETYLDIGITLFMNFQIEEALENFIEACKFRNRNDQKIEKNVIDKANNLTKVAASLQIDLHDDYFMTIHVAWSYYYFFLGLIGYFTNQNNPQKESESCYNAITNFTRCITLNPTLPESFYYRAVLRTYAHSCLENQSNLDLNSSTNQTKNSETNKTHLINLDLEKRKTTYGRNTRRFNQIIGNKIISSNLLREALNDVLNANALKNISNFEKERLETHDDTFFNLKLLVLKCFILFALERQKDAFTELQKLTDGDKNSELLFEITAMKALITQNENDVKDAFKFEKDDTFIGTKSEKLSSIILFELANLNFPLDDE